MVGAFERVAQDGPDKILREVDSWWPRFKQFLEEDKNKTWQDLDTLDNFHLMLSDFLFDIENSKEQNQFKFNGTLVCSQPVPPIIAIQHQLFYGLSSSVPPPTEYLPAKALIDTIIEDANLSTVAFATSPIYEAWETDKIISVELWRNLSLCLIAVAIISLALLGDFRLTVMVVTCILATLVDLVSFQALSPFIPLIFFLNCLVALFVSFHFHCILATLVDLISFLLILLSSFLSCPAALFVSFHSILFLYFHFAFFLFIFWLSSLPIKMSIFPQNLLHVDLVDWHPALLGRDHRRDRLRQHRPRLRSLR